MEKQLGNLTRTTGNCLSATIRKSTILKITCNCALSRPRHLSQWPRPCPRTAPVVSPRATLRTAHTRAVSTDTRAVSTDTRADSTETRAVFSDTRAVSTDTRAVSTDTRAVSSDTRGDSTDTRAVSSDTRGVSSDTRAVSSDTRMCLPTRELCLPTRELSSRSRGNRNHDCRFHDLHQELGKHVKNTTYTWGTYTICITKTSAA